MQAPPSRDVSPFLSSAYQVLKDVFSYFHSKTILLFCLLIIVAVLETTGMSMLLPLLSKLGISSDLSPDAAFLNLTFLDFSKISLDLLLLITFCIFTIRIAVQYMIDYFAAGLSSQYAAHWRSDLFKAFTNADMRFFSKHKSATLISAIVRESDRVRLSMEQLNQIFKTSFFCLAYIFVAIGTSWETCFLLGIFGTLSFLVTRSFSKRADRIGKKTYSAFERLQKSAVEYLQASKLLKVTACERYAQEEIGNTINDVKNLSRQENIHPFMIHSVFEFLGIFTLVSVIYLSVSVLNVSGAEMIVALFLFMRVYSRMTSLEQFRQSFRIYVTSFFALKKLKEEASEFSESFYTSGNAPYISDVPPEINIQHIDLSYEDKHVLKNVSFQIPAGQIIGIAGGSGAGKTSLIDAIVGLTPVQKGDILIDQVNLRKLSIKDFRKHIGYVSQQTILFHDTVLNNICWGNPDVSREDAIKAAQLAQADEFISGLPKGYDTIIGDDGKILSGGERQRLGLARALVGDKTLLILDETTSALDALTEAEIIKTIAALKGKATIIIITHRLSSLACTDKIFFLQDGILAQTGSFKDLRNIDGPFQKLLSIQEKSISSS